MDNKRDYGRKIGLGPAIVGLIVLVVGLAVAIGSFGIRSDFYTNFSGKRRLSGSVLEKCYGVIDPSRTSPELATISTADLAIMPLAIDIFSPTCKRELELSGAFDAPSNNWFPYFAGEIINIGMVRNVLANGNFNEASLRAAGSAIGASKTNSIEILEDLATISSNQRGVILLAAATASRLATIDEDGQDDVVARLHSQLSAPLQESFLRHLFLFSDFNLARRLFVEIDNNYCVNKMCFAAAIHNCKAADDGMTRNVQLKQLAISGNYVRVVECVSIYSESKSPSKLAASLSNFAVESGLSHPSCSVEVLFSRLKSRAIDDVAVAGLLDQRNVCACGDYLTLGQLNVGLVWTVMKGWGRAGLRNCLAVPQVEDLASSGFAWPILRSLCEDVSGRRKKYSLCKNDLLGTYVALVDKWATKANSK